MRIYEITFTGRAGPAVGAEFDDCEVILGTGTTTLRADLAVGEGGHGRYSSIWMSLLRCRGLPARASLCGSRGRNSRPAFTSARRRRTTGVSQPRRIGAVFSQAQSCNVVKILHGILPQKRYTFSHEDPGRQSQVPVSVGNPKNRHPTCLVPLCSKAITLMRVRQKLPRASD